MLPVSLVIRIDYPFSFLSRLFDVAGIRPVSCVTMLQVSLDWPFLIAPSVFFHVYLSRVLWNHRFLYCSFLIAPSVFWELFSNLYLCCVLWDHRPLDWPFLIVPSVFSNVYLSYVLWDHRSLYWPFLIVPSDLSNVYLVLFFFVMCLCVTMLSVSLDGPFLVSPSVFSNVYMMLLVFVLCLVWPCCQCLWIVHSWFPLQFSLTFI